jgi:uncharacterized protein YajQ (UPF0234 family)
MAKKEHSFDISASVDMQEVKNAVMQAQKEVDNRYDFKGILKEINLNEKDKFITLTTSSDNKIDAMLDIVISKASKRDISPYALKLEKTEDSSGGNRKAYIKIIDTIRQEDSKKIVKEIKNTKLKVNSTIQGEEIRVTAKSIDDLQAVIAHLKSLELDLPLRFGNFK